MKTKLISKILWEKGFNPFSLNYDLSRSIKNLSKYNDVEVDQTTESIIKYSSIFNSYFKEICKELNKRIEGISIAKEELTRLIVGDLNRTDILVTSDAEKAILSQGTFDFNSYSNTYIQNEAFANNSEPAWALIDSAIDVAILNLNYLNYVDFSKPKPDISELDIVDLVKHLTIIGSIHNAVKQSYEKVIWNEGEIIADGESIQLKQNENNLLLENAGLTRLVNNIHSKNLEYQFKELIELETFQLYHKTRKFQIIKNITNESGILVIGYQAKRQEPSASYLQLFANLNIYYPYYRTDKFSKIQDLSLQDLVNMFSMLQDFVRMLPMPVPEQTEIYDIEKFRKFAPLISKKQLIEYFRNISKYSTDQVECFISLLIKNDSKHDLYKYPVYEYGDNLYFSSCNVKRANILYLIDSWLKEIDSDMSLRGHAFEKYIKDYFKNQKMNSFAKFEIVEKSNFEISVNSKVASNEEIDLVIKLSNTIILAEIKCISYPIESNEFYSARQTLKSASQQITRKSTYIKDNWDSFSHILGSKENMKVIELIITNYPHYAGRKIEGVPILDCNLLFSYFISGEFKTVKFDTSRVLEEHVISYYNSVETFESNFENFINDPVPISELVKRQRVEKCLVTLEEAQPKIFSQRVVYIPMNF